MKPRLGMIKADITLCDSFTCAGQAASTDVDKADHEQKQQQLAARLAQLPSSNGHHKQPQEQPQIPQQPTDAEAVQAWHVHEAELKQLQQKGREGGWLIHHSEVR